MKYKILLITRSSFDCTCLEFTNFVQILGCGRPLVYHRLASAYKTSKADSLIPVQIFSKMMQAGSYYSLYFEEFGSHINKSPVKILWHQL